MQQVEFSNPAMPEAASKFAMVTARAAGAPTATIHLADGDQLRLVGATGLPAAYKQMSRVPVTSTLAGLVIGCGHPVIISDIADDPRVPRYAPARAVNARAYAGFPIRDPQEEIVGVCAVLDYQPRQWSPGELAGIDEVAQACMAFVAVQHAHEEADRQRRFLDALLESLQTGVAACDAQGRLVFANEAIRRLSGGLPDDGEIRAWAEQCPLIGGDGAPLPADAMPLQRALAGQVLRNAEVRVDLPGERSRIVSTDAQPITGAGGRRLGAVVTARDITDRRRTERFRTVELAVSSVLAHAESAQQAGPRVLEAVCATLRWPYAELWLVDEQSDSLIPAAQYSAVCPDGVPEPELGGSEALTRAAWRTGKPVWITDLDISYPAGETPQAPLRTGLAIPASSGGKIVAVLSFFADVVEDPADPLLVLLAGIATHVAQFLERRRAEELALALARSKDEYLALVGHELRTPLTNIAAYLGVLGDTDSATIADELPDMLDVLTRNSDTLRHIVDQLLDLDALDSGYAELAREPVDLNAAVRDATMAVEATAAAAGITLELDLTANTIIAGDRERIRQVVAHLLDNALNHTTSGGHISVSLTQRTPAVVELALTDTGIGIPADEQEQLFSRFYRSSRTRGRRIPGSGLGLSISRAIIERHHGSIRLIPGTETGTRICVRLPIDAG